MLGREQIDEVLRALSANKLRTALTGFSVGWGVLLLVILLSSGAGLSNGIRSNLGKAGYSNQTAELIFESIEIPYRGLPKWYQPNYTVRDCQTIADQLSDVVKLHAPYRESWGNTFSAGKLSAKANLLGTIPDFGRLREIQFVVPGSRFINEEDERERRKVLIISDALARRIFSRIDEAIGKRVFIGQHAMTVIGVYKGDQGQWSNNFVPLSTLQALKLYSDSKSSYAISGMHMLVPSLRQESDEAQLKSRILAITSQLKGYSPEDSSSLSIYSQALQQAMFGQITMGLNAFMWIIGMSTLAIGLVGVVSIMQIAVTERKKEIGIRKALGARPRVIVEMILIESVLITLLSGLAGLAVGVGLMKLVNDLMTSTGLGTKQIGDQGINLFLNPIINLPTAVSAVVVMVVGGLIAGYLPARKATRIPTVEAMRH